MAHLPAEFKEHVASLCGSLIGEPKARPFGTCFFVQAENSTGTVFDYIVTAKHVVEDLSKAGGLAFVRMNKGRIGEFNKGVVDLPIPTRDRWLYHDDPSVDLAVLPTTVASKEGTIPPTGEAYRLLSLKLEGLDRQRSAAPYWPPLEPEPVLFIAMTSQFQGARGNLPTIRMGHLALVTEEPLKGHYGRSHYYVIEAQVYPGNSGAPVSVEITDAETKESGWYSLGVLAFSYPSEEELKIKRGVQNAYYNLGLSLVVPIEKVVEIVDSEKEKARRESIQGPDMPGVA